jgi:hypothetical protein
MDGESFRVQARGRSKATVERLCWGAFSVAAQSVSSARRGSERPTIRHINRGIRVARTCN